MLATLHRLPTWLRFALYASVGVLVLAIAESFESGGVGRLTADTASRAMLKWCIPILLAGLGGLFSERASIVNIGLEGMMILGTWFGAWAALEFSPWMGLVFGVLGGALGGLIHAVATVSFGVDHVISGVAINIMAPGVTTFLSSEVFGNRTQSPDVPGLGEVDVPVLAGGTFFGAETPDILGSIADQGVFFVSDLASFARGLVSGIAIFSLIALALVPLSGWFLWKTRAGLQLRSAGEYPLAGESLGVNVIRRMYLGVVVSGALAGLGGAFIAMELTGFYQNGQTGGRGFIGLAALIFGNWRPLGILAAAFLFGYPFGVSLRDLDGQSTHALLLVVSFCLAVVSLWAATARRLVDAVMALVFAVVMFAWYVQTDVAPDWLPNAMPYVIVLLVLVFAAQRLRAPAFDGQIYRRGAT